MPGATPSQDKVSHCCPVSCQTALLVLLIWSSNMCMSLYQAPAPKKTKKAQSSHFVRIHFRVITTWFSVYFTANKTALENKPFNVLSLCSYFYSFVPTHFPFFFFLSNSKRETLQTEIFGFFPSGRKNSRSGGGRRKEPSYQEWGRCLEGAADSTGNTEERPGLSRMLWVIIPCSRRYLLHTASFIIKQAMSHDSLSLSCSH